MAGNPGPPPQSLVDAVALRCHSCGAPLSGRSEGELLQCEHCGTVQRMVDARNFLDQISLQVNSFLRQAVPAGLDLSRGGGMIDPVARHNLFVQGVKPRLDTEYGEIRFQCFNLLSRGQIALPFTVLGGVTGPADPKPVFLFQAKVRSVAMLAVDDDSRKLIAEVDGVSTTYAQLLTNLGLLTQRKPERYPFLARNSREAADSLKEVPQLDALRTRMSGLSQLSEGMDQLTQGHAREAKAAMQGALADLTKAHDLASQDFGLSLMLAGIEEEQQLTRASLQLAEIAQLSSGGRPGQWLAQSERLLRALTEVPPGMSLTWAVNMGKASRSESILAMATDLRRAQVGQGTVKVVRSPGSLLVPFWVVEVPYSFQTGALWKVRGVEVSETMLVSADFLLDEGAATLSDPSRVVTDVFAARAEATWRTRVAGRETAISGGGMLRNVYAGAAPGGLPGTGVVPPVTTREEASTLVQSYLQWSRGRDREIDQKLRLSSPRVVDLIYIPTIPEAAPGPVIPWMGPLSPRSAGDPATLHELATG